MTQDGERKIQYAHSNHGLFADHYLKDILPELDIWNTINEEAEEVFNQIQKLYFDKKEFLKPDIPEDAVEKEFIEPILDIINPHYVLRPQKKGGVRRWIPDYGLCASDEAKRKTYKHIKSSGVFKDVVCILEAKRWERPLDKKMRARKQRDFFEDDTDNPSLQTVNYLLHTKTKWGILTNGRLWRIYERDQSAGLEKWFEVDLVRILDPAGQQSLDFEQISQLDAFKYFYLFFRLQAFPEFLQKVLDESVDYELKVSEDLKENVYKALRLLAEGFVQSNPEQFDREKDKDKIRRKCFVLLYRILFILFAESKPYKAQERLLPRGNRSYDDDYSLWSLRHTIAEKAGEDIKKASDSYKRFPDTRCVYLEQLKSLFHLVDVGSEHEDFNIPKSAFHVPAYNGGLFDPAHFDETWKITDRYLGQVIDLLSRAPKEDGVVLHFIDYGYLDVDKLGGIYEGLLENRLEIAEDDIVPAVVDKKERWIPVDEAKDLKKVKKEEKVKKGEYYPVTDRGERKTSGSYYTPSILVDYIVKHTLEPIIQQSKKEIEPEQKKLERQLKKREKEGMKGEVIKLQKQLDELLPRKILSLRILDPAMGSGHFLVSATKYLAKRLTELSTGEEVEEDANEYRIAKRRIVENCIFGVDKNELAVELAKVSLWIETVARDRALSFLDHHLRWGDSLLGSTIDSLGKLPSEKKSTQKQTDMFSAPLSPVIQRAIPMYTLIENRPSITADDVKRKGEIFQNARDILRPFREVVDVWMADWFLEVDREDYESAHALLKIQDETELEREFQKLRNKGWFKEVQALYDKHRFFHWELEFPESYFDEKGKRLKDFGFDAVIGNPPWERIRLEEVQFFTGRFPQIALAPRASDRKGMIKKLEDENPELWKEYREAKDDADRILRYFHKSGFYPLMGRGDTNFYAVFAERAARVVMRKGRVGFLTPSGIATDNTTQFFFQELVDNHRLSQLLDFENKKEFFEEIHSSFKFSIVLFGGISIGIEKIRMAFFLHRDEFEKLIAKETDRLVELQPDDFALFNPNTRTCPIFRTQRDYELTKKIYERSTVLIDNTGDEEINPWGISFLRMFDMTNDSHLFKTAEELKGDGFYFVEGNKYKKKITDEETKEEQEVYYLSLYEAKMIHYFDHRYAEGIISDERLISTQASELVPVSKKENPQFSINPRFWVMEQEVQNQIDDGRKWFICFRDIARATDVRTCIATIIPYVGVGNTLPLIIQDNPNALLSSCLLANLSSIPLDYATRQKVSSTHLNFFIVEQLPVLPPERYEEEFHGKKLIDIISPKVLELCYTAHDLAGFAKDMGHVDKKGKVKKPFKWDSERRFHLRCQLDALYFILYGLDTGEANEILETFPIVKRDDAKNYGRYRTRDLIINYMRAYEAGDLDVWIQDQS